MRTCLPNVRSGQPVEDRAAFERDQAQGLAQVGDQVAGVLDAAAEPHQIGRDRGARALDRLVGHRLRHLDQRLDAAERLGEREQPRARRDRRGVGMAEADHPAEPGPAHVLDAAASRAAARRPRRRCARGRPSAGAACAARGARGSSRTGRERRRRRSGRTAAARSHSASRAITAPPTTSEWPPRYLVVECTTKSAPSSSGRWLAGVANVLSTATSAFCACATMPSMSTTFEQRVGRALDPDQPRVVAARPARARRGRSGRRGRTRGPSGSAPCRPAGRCRRTDRPAGRRASRPRTRR